MRTLLFGTVLGAVTAAAFAGVLSMMDTIPMSTRILVVVIAAVSVSVLVWLLGATWSFLRWVQGALRRRSVRKLRRRNLAADRSGSRTRTSEADDAETVLMTGARKRGRRSRAEIANLLEKAEAATQAGDFHGAAELLSDVLDADPEHLEAHLARGRVYLDLGDYNRAMSDFVMAEDLEPDSPEPPVAMGDLYFVRKDYARAIGCFDVALELSPDHAMAYCRRGLSHFYRKNYPVALEDLLRARRLDPDIANLQTHIAQTEKKVKEGGKEKPRSKRR